jgi:hypothetical protein
VLATSNNKATVRITPSNDNNTKATLTVAIVLLILNFMIDVITASPSIATTQLSNIPPEWS